MMMGLFICGKGSRKSKEQDASSSVAESRKSKAQEEEATERTPSRDAATVGESHHSGGADGRESSSSGGSSASLTSSHHYFRQLLSQEQSASASNDQHFVGHLEHGVADERDVVWHEAPHSGNEDRMQHWDDESGWSSSTGSPSQREGIEGEHSSGANTHAGSKGGAVAHSAVEPGKAGLVGSSKELFRQLLKAHARQSSASLSQQELCSASSSPGELADDQVIVTLPCDDEDQLSSIKWDLSKPGARVLDVSCGMGRRCPHNVSRDYALISINGVVVAGASKDFILRQWTEAQLNSSHLRLCLQPCR
eukprot:gb/GFBE01035313.1/.p1 GENE.gb/GFBE01035313.1/~~gb/GFBE01035313.1/.p1  ORF type:complete len:308 (+),score=55.74 gb/GFBE01035313.1/:1-924(+)